MRSSGPIGARERWMQALKRTHTSNDLPPRELTSAGKSQSTITCLIYAYMQASARHNKVGLLIEKKIFLYGLIISTG